MISLLQVRDMVELYGRIDAYQISQKFSVPLPMIKAMLDQLTAMGKLEKINQSSCLKSKHCTCCLKLEQFSLKVIK
ncbi:MAG: FeoC-like transcriptional regulator [Candidatus Arsenophonus melophagi]|nr:FeoC-like transcriptional regulator [Candidatus Arsenophonus melophagi]